MLRLKSRVLWLVEGDRNTKFFHMYASHRKNINTIFEIKNGQGNMVRSFQEKEEVRVEYFQNIFTEPKGCPITKIMEVLRLFSRMISKEMNGELTKEISEEEVDHVLHSFQKGKISSMDGFTLDFI